ncbi:AraC family transcriptional regulator [Actinomadura sp. NBRC 104425]|uniref:AraC family transcriptional regulator n=1 Tax=Actinomadura sp. NBRC 104425 TaxID=3032204 RepID=UPI002552794A|nr:AraC family transcriptional regulator [Actinomadura sp. NBRC 104425]
MSVVSQEVAHYWRHPVLPDVDLLQARYVTHRFGRHTHDGYVIALIEAGVEAFEHAGSTERAPKGSLAVLNPGVVHTGYAGAPGGWAYRVLYPAVGVVADVAAELGARAGTPYFPDTVIERTPVATLVRAAHRAGEGGDALAASSLLRTALGALLRHHARDMPAERGAAWPASVRAARDILHDRLVDPPTLEELAEAVGTRPFRLVRAFRAATGLPPHAYLNQVRVRRARGLLDRGLSPAEVAARTGFADQSHLTRHFKRVVGVPPGAYQHARGVARSRSAPRDTGPTSG